MNNLIFPALHNLALAIAPELSAAPLYVIEKPADYPQPDCWAWASRRADGPLRSALIDAGQWRGQGSVIVVCEELEGEDLHGLLLHEVAHLLPVSLPGIDRNLTPIEASHERELISKWAGEPTVEPARCFAHGPDFVRCCCHLQHRAAAAGCDLSFPSILAARNYCLPPLVRFARALGDEPQRLAGETFKTILAHPALDSFTSIFRSQDNAR